MLLMTREKSSQEAAKRSSSDWRAVSLSGTIAELPANISSRTRMCRAFVFIRNLAKLKNLPSVRVRRKTPSVITFFHREKKQQRRRNKAVTEHSLALLRISGDERALWNKIRASISSCNDLTRLRNLRRRTADFYRTMYSHSLLTTSYALVKWTNAMYGGRRC